MDLQMLIAENNNSKDLSILETTYSHQHACPPTTSDFNMELNLVKKYLGDSDSYISEEECNNSTYSANNRERKVGSIMRSDIVTSTTLANRRNLPNIDALKILTELDIGPYDDNDGFNNIVEFEKYLVENHFDLAQRICELDDIPIGPSKRQQQRDRMERLKKMTAAVNRTVFEPKAKLPKGSSARRPKQSFNK